MSIESGAGTAGNNLTLVITGFAKKLILVKIGTAPFWKIIIFCIDLLVMNETN
jgi:hypothetical protein